MSTKDLRQEYVNLRSSSGFKDTIGTTCANCGSDECIEYHHIVPLSLGGTNRPSNIIPLCHKCHCAAHRGRHISHYTEVDHSKLGRKSKVSDEDAFAALDMWVNGQIGTTKCKEMMGLSARTEPVNTSQFKRWASARGIARVKNTIDVAATINPFSLVDGKVVGWYELPDGERHDIVFHDTGINDVVYRYIHIKDQPEMTLYELRESGYAPLPFRENRKQKMNERVRPSEAVNQNHISPEWWAGYRKKLRAEAAGM